MIRCLNCGSLKVSNEIEADDSSDVDGAWCFACDLPVDAEEIEWLRLAAIKLRHLYRRALIAAFLES
jgi:hypothetical protein